MKVCRYIYMISNQELLVVEGCDVFHFTIIYIYISKIIDIKGTN